MSDLELTSGGETRDRDVTASEVANYVFCAKAWHLECVLGASASVAAEQRRACGEAAHAVHGVRIWRFQRVGPWLVRATTLLFVAAAVLSILGILLSRR